MKRDVTNNLIIIYGSLNLGATFDNHWTKYLMILVAIYFIVQLLKIFYKK